MINRIYVVMAAVLILGLASAATAATSPHRVTRNYIAKSLVQPVNFQSNWNVSY